MKKKICHMIPEEEKQCVWMTGGLISYKLCTRDYRCEDCIFDQVIRNEAAVEARALRAGPAAAFSPATTDAPPATAALFYHGGHCWAKVEDPDLVRIGIDGILAQIVAPVKTVVLPQPGDQVAQGQSFAHIIQEKHIVELISPLTGTVLEVNQNLKAMPHAAASDPWRQGWLVTVKPDKLEHDLKALMFGRKATEWYQKKEHEVAAARAEMAGAADTAALGLTLQDGGEPVSLAELLSPEQYDRIIDSLFTPENAA